MSIPFLTPHPQCYDCDPKRENKKTFPICTIRNTPEKPVHCVVWAEELYKLLFGDVDESALVDNTDQGDKPEDKEDAQIGKAARSNIMQAVKRPEQDWSNTGMLEQYAKNVFEAVFKTEIELKLSIKSYKGAQEPTPLAFQDQLSQVSTDKDVHLVWDVKRAQQEFVKAIVSMWQDHRDRIGALVFDKDDPIALDFVTCATNLRAHVFHIPACSVFEVKGIAGNIVHAIATTNAIVAGIQVLEAQKLIHERAKMGAKKAEQGWTKESKMVWVLRHPSGSQGMCYFVGCFEMACLCCVVHQLHMYTHHI